MLLPCVASQLARAWLSYVRACHAAGGCVGSADMQRILVLNPKGGSGKTTVATNLASYYAGRGQRPLLSDNDPQGSSTRWLKKRKPERT